MKTGHDELAYYAKDSDYTKLGLSEWELSEISDNLSDMVKYVQNLVVHIFTAKSFYGVDLYEESLKDANLRFGQQILERIREIQPYPLHEHRSADKRVAGACHHFNKLLTGILRAKGVPSRMRYGFASYFRPGKWEDHSVVEVWDSNGKSWDRVDPQFDDSWVMNLKIDHDILRVPYHVFKLPHEVWSLVRNGESLPENFGSVNGEVRGLWFIAGCMLRDLASLNKAEMLQWDVWKGMPRPNNTMTNKKTLERFDKIARLLSRDDLGFHEINEFYNDIANEVLVPSRVFNAMIGHLEYVGKS